MKNVLVTGGAGFIGAHLCRKLLQHGQKVVCLDNLFTGSIDNIKDLFDNKDFEFIEADVTERLELPVNQIYNLACPASPPHYQADPIKTMKTSVLGILNLLELAKKNNATILQASTSEVYGDPLEHPQKESYRGHVNPIGIRSCYDEGKRCAETLMMDYMRKYSLDIRIVRIFNTYGPGMRPDDGRVVSNFILQALKNEDITIYGDGSQTRSFCFVSDLIDGLYKMMNQKGFSGPVNLGNPQERTVKDLAELVIKITNSQSNIIYLPLPQDDPVKRKPDITLAEEKLAWKPVVEIDRGIEETVQYFKNYI